MQEIVSRVVNLPEILRLLISAAVALPTNKTVAAVLTDCELAGRLVGLTAKTMGILAL